MDAAKEKSYLAAQRFADLDARYDECSRMLEGLHQALSEWRGSIRTGKVVREDGVTYGSEQAPSGWSQAVEVTLKSEKSLP